MILALIAGFELLLLLIGIMWLRDQQEEIRTLRDALEQECRANIRHRTDLWNRWLTEQTRLEKP